MLVVIADMPFTPNEGLILSPIKFSKFKIQLNYHCQSCDYYSVEMISQSLSFQCVLSRYKQPWSILGCQPITGVNINVSGEEHPIFSKRSSRHDFYVWGEQLCVKSTEAATFVWLTASWFENWEDSFSKVKFSKCQGSNFVEVSFGSLPKRQWSFLCSWGCYRGIASQWPLWGHVYVQWGPLQDKKHSRYKPDIRKTG